MADDSATKTDDASNSPYAEGEKVLAYHGPMIYEAKIQRAELRKKEWQYFIHYLGWSKNWDEWVGLDRLMKVTDANVKRQKALFKDQNGDKRKGPMGQSKQRASSGSAMVEGDKENSKTSAVRGRKRKSDVGVEDAIKLPLPGQLKKQLIDDCEFVTKLGKLVKLPRTPTVQDILNKYLEFKTKKENISDDGLSTVLNGLRTYFDKALPAMLLYKVENDQYQEFCGNGAAPSDIYGAEHFLRLFVKLPELLAYVNMENEALAQLQLKLADFLKYLQKHQTTLFLSSYDGPKVDITRKKQLE